jgi:hypothetical protein
MVRSRHERSIVFRSRQPPNNAIDTDREERRAFVAPLFTAGYGERYVCPTNANS